jgi:hypothetical protein
VKFRKKPVVVDARQYDGRRDIPGVVHSPVLEPTPDNPTGMYGQLYPLGTGGTCIVGDWVVHHQNGAIEVLKPHEFAETYEPVPSSALPWIDSHRKVKP